MPLPAPFDPRRVFAWAARARQALLGLLALAGAVLSPALLSSCGGVGTGGTGTYSAGGTSYQTLQNCAACPAGTYQSSTGSSVANERPRSES